MLMFFFLPMTVFGLSMLGTVLMMCVFIPLILLLIIVVFINILQVGGFINSVEIFQVFSVWNSWILSTSPSLVRLYNEKVSEEKTDNLTGISAKLGVSAEASAFSSTLRQSIHGCIWQACVLRQVLSSGALASRRRFEKNRSNSERVSETQRERIQNDCQSFLAFCFQRTSIYIYYTFNYELVTNSRPHEFNFHLFCSSFSSIVFCTMR